MYLSVKIKMRRFFIFYLVVFVFANGSYSQQTNILDKMLPDLSASPEAEALRQLGNYGVNNSSGMPDIEVPLYELDFLGYKLPLSLRYMATPIKPGYNYDVCGRGWVITGNSCVSRTIRDVADEERGFKLDESTLVKQIYKSSRGETWTLNEELQDLNFRYDRFNAVLPNGRSFDFFIKADKEHEKKLLYITDTANKDLKIECKYDTQDIRSFSITDEEGIVFNFSLADYAQTDCGYTGGNYHKSKQKNVTWHLTSINVPNKGTIGFSYTDLKRLYTYTIDEPVLSIRQWTAPRGGVIRPGDIPKEIPGEVGGMDAVKSLVKNNSVYDVRFVSCISCATAFVKFEYDGDMVKSIKTQSRIFEFDYKKDLVSRTLVKLTIHGYKNQDVDKLVYRFDYTGIGFGRNVDHWGNYNGSSDEKNIAMFNMFVSNITGPDDFQNKIKSVGFCPYYGRYKSDAPTPTIGISSGMSSGGNQYQNYGFSQSNNPYEPKQTINDNPYFFNKFMMQSDMSSDCRSPLSPEQHGVLHSITYPNGGKTIFVFENHRFLTAMLRDGSFEPDRRKQRVANGGGFRIKSISNYSADGKCLSSDVYEYGFTNNEVRSRNLPFPRPANDSKYIHTDCGEAVVDPNILTYMSFEDTYQAPRYALEMFTGISVDGRSGSYEGLTFYDVQNKGWGYNVSLCALNFRKLLGGRPAVVYPEITVYHGSFSGNPQETTGKTVYKYDIYDANPQNYMYRFTCRPNTPPDTVYYEMVRFAENALYSEENSVKRNQLVEKIDYTVVKRQEQSEYEYAEIAREKYTYRDYCNSISVGYIYDNWHAQSFRGYQAYWDIFGCTGGTTVVPAWWYRGINENLCASKVIKKDITKTIQTEGFYAEPYTTSEEYSYVFGDHLKKKKYYDNNNKIDEVSYLLEGNDTASVIFKDLKEQHILTLPVTSTKMVSGMYETEGIKVDYKKLEDGRILPSVIYVLNYPGDKYRKKYEIKTYGSFELPVEVYDFDTDMTTVYIYDYDKVCAEVKNATYADVKAAIAAIPGFNVGDITLLDKLREKLPDAQINTWTHIPDFGVTAHSDVTGKTIYYDYDGLGRLKEVYTYKDNVVSGENKILLNSYSYKYKN